MSEEWKEPKSMEELVYFTRRKLGEKGRAKVWTFKEVCNKCGKGLMSKPKDPKTGRPKIRATEYVCPDCGNSVEKQEYEDSLFANVEYTCPACQKEGKIKIPYKRKTYLGTKALVFNCESCGEKIGITKKMKEPKKKKK